MPIYEYECKKCGNRFDAFRWASEISDPAPCPKCGSMETEQQLSVFSSGSSNKSSGCGDTGFS